ncbi:TolB family protein [Paenibacillus oceani]|uniref:Uncharacterized protein n=1 Tax=Paenibacillus oceani TaxID=2772510 RepID=A0A927CC50_9BACL|nr:hypothetical protein [Paenibacillus oceani]MBD2863541.1 hypothetical protein [Paenibacillus oceani]
MVHESTFQMKERILSVPITDGDDHTFFGYYDNPAFSGDDRFHLVHRVPFCDRMQKAGDSAEIGLIELDSGTYIRLSETTAWNFQQGSMLQWHPLAPNDQVIHNATVNGQYRGVIRHIWTQAVTYLDNPVACVDPVGKYALGINFARMFDFRPGYGYADLADPFRSALHPAEDGVFRIDLKSGASRLIVSLDEIWSFIKPIFRTGEAKLTINHITFNTNGTRFLMLARWTPPNGKSHLTALLTANADGSELRCLSTDTMQSHYHWRDESRFVMYGGGRHGHQLYVYEDATDGREPEVIDADYFLRDGHCSYSPDRTRMLYDSYPDKSGMRHLYMYDLNLGRGKELGSYYSPPHIAGDIRCDLHPRWNRTGTAISFDSAHEGRRRVYVMDLRELLQD